MYHYFGYGLEIRSALRLPGFVPSEPTANPDIEVRSAPVEHERWAELNDDGLKLTGIADGVMRFHVMHGETITVELLPDADEDYARAIISGELIAALLRQRGLLTLHGSCVARDGHAIGFIGNSGWGKSTLAMHFVAQGYRLLCDDVLAVSFDERSPSAVPGYPQVKLRPDSGARYAADGFETRPSAHSETDKRLVVCADDFQEEPVPLRKLYLLEPRNRPVSGVEAMPFPNVFAELMGHTRATKLIKNEAFTQAHFQQITQLLETVPVERLHRRMDLNALSEVYELIKEDLQSLSSTETPPHRVLS